MGLINIFKKVLGYSNKFVTAQTTEKIRLDWQQIDTLLAQGSPSQLQKALLTADKTLDTALKDLVAGETMGERLKNAATKFEKPVYDKIWKAHKLRNTVVHEAGFEPTHTMVREAVADLRHGLHALGVRV